MREALVIIDMIMIIIFNMLTIGLCMITICTWATLNVRKEKYGVWSFTSGPPSPYRLPHLSVIVEITFTKFPCSTVPICSLS